MTKSTTSTANKHPKRKKQSLSPTPIESATSPVSTSTKTVGSRASPLDSSAILSPPVQQNQPSPPEIFQHAKSNPLPVVPNVDVDNRPKSTKFRKVQYIDDDSDTDVFPHQKVILPSNLKSTGNTDIATNQDTNILVVTPSKPESDWGRLPIETSLLFAPTTQMPPLTGPLLSIASCQTPDPSTKNNPFDKPPDHNHSQYTTIEQDFAKEQPNKNNTSSLAGNNPTAATDPFTSHKIIPPTVNPYAMKPNLTPPAGASLLLIKDLDTKTRTPWTIHACVTTKDEIVNFAQNHGTGTNQRFSFTLVDTSNVTMRATCFKNAIIKFHDMLKCGNVYSFSNAIIQESKFPASYTSNFELVFFFRSTIVPLPHRSLANIQQEFATTQPKPIVISDLTMTTYHWVIRARVSDKTQIRRFVTRNDQPGSVFNVTLVDDSKAHIRGVFFGDAVEKFFDMLIIDNCYSFSNANLVTPDPTYSNDPIEIKFKPDSDINLITNDETIVALLPLYTTIADLKPVQVNNWPLSARLVRKSEMIKWENDKREGMVFNILLFDSSGFDIRASFFDEAALKYYDLLHPGNMYAFSGGTVRTATFSINSTSPYEISFFIHSSIKLIAEENTDIIRDHPQAFHFETLKNIIYGMDINKKYDVIGMVTMVGPLVTLPGKTENDHVFSCGVEIVDESNFSASITLWGESAIRAVKDFIAPSVVAFCPAYLNEYNGILYSLTAIGPTIISPSGPRTQWLLSFWEDRTSHDIPFNSLERPEIAVLMDSVSPSTYTLRDSELMQFTSISDLQPGKEWVICGRVYYKSDIFEKELAAGTSRQFAVHILDSSGVDIYALFSSLSTEKYYTTIQPGLVYSFSGGVVCPAQVNSPCASKYQIWFNIGVIIKVIHDDDTINRTFNFKTLLDLSQYRCTKFKADIVTVVKDVGEITSTTNSKGQETSHCNLTVTDDSETELTLTVWNVSTSTILPSLASNPVVAFFPVRVKDYKTVAIEICAIGQILVSPSSSRSHELQDWWANKSQENPPS